MTRPDRWLRVLVAGLLLGAVLPGAAQPDEGPDSVRDSAATPSGTAQTDEDAPLDTVELPPEAPPPVRPPRMIDEIIVTAQKTEQRLQDVPISVTALQGEFMRENAIGDLTEASTYVPNVRVESTSPSSPQVFIRGFGTNTFNPSFEPSVGLVQDEVFFGRGAYFTESMFDLARIEVLRGPQGTLFGKNTIAGVFNLVSRGPPAKGLAGNLNYRLGEWGETRIESGMGGRFGDYFGARLAILDARRDGRLRNTKAERLEDTLNQSAQRLTLEFQPLDSVDLQLIGQLSDTTVNFWPRQLMRLDQDTRDYLSNFDSQIEDDPRNFQTSFDIPGTLNKDSETLTGRGHWDMDPALGLDNLGSTLILGTSRLHVDQYQDLDVSPADLIRLFVDTEDFRQRTAEWRVSGLGGSPFGWGEGLQFVVGAYYFGADYHIDTGVEAGMDLASYAATNDAQQLASGGALPGLPIGAVGAVGGALPPIAAEVIGEDYYAFDYRQKTQAVALFGQFTWDITARWSLTPGLRYNRERKRSDARGFGVCEAKPVTGQCVVQTLLSAEDYAVLDVRRRETKLSPKLSLLYHASDDLTVFATVARGFKSGGVNAISFTGEDLEYEPERARSLEAGLKSQWLRNTLTLNATAYRMDFDDLQVLAFNGVFFDVANAGTAYSQGLELDALWLTPFVPLTVNASLGLLDARYESYPNAPAPVSEGLDAQQDLSGRRVAFAPRVSATLIPSLEFGLGAMRLNASLSIRHQGDQYTDTDLDPATFVPANTIYSARLQLSGGDGAWSLNLGAKNLTDKRVLNQVIDTALFPGTYLAQQQPGRSLYGSINLAW